MIRSELSTLDVSVDRDDAGRLVVTWTGGTGPFSVAVGTTPEAIDHEHPMAPVTGSPVVLDVGSGPHFVAVVPSSGRAVVAAERRLPLVGAVNFRDLGGYPTVDGSLIRWGRVFRSDAISELTPADLELVHQLGVRVVYDLRQASERGRAPCALPAGSVRIELIAMGEHGDSRSVIDRIFDGELDAIDATFMAEAYIRMLEREATAFGRLLSGIASSGSLPALFHCTAGKDRTGISAALLLSVLGVDDTTILDDYELTNRYWGQHRRRRLAGGFAKRGIDMGRFDALFDASRGTMERTLTGLRGQYGGVERYLVERAGMAPEALEALRRQLLDRRAPGS